MKLAQNWDVSNRDKIWTKWGQKQDKIGMKLEQNQDKIRMKSGQKLAEHKIQ